MTFDEVLDHVIEMLQRRGRVSYRALKRQFDLDDAYVEDLKAEIIEVHHLAADQDGTMLVWLGAPGTAPKPAEAPQRAPLSYTPPHLTEKILASRSALEGERKQVTVLFADLKGSMELLADRDPEEARQLLDERRSPASLSPWIRPSGRHPAFLALPDVPVEDPQWQALDPTQRRQRTLEAIKGLLLRESQVQPLLLVFENLHWIDAETQAVLDGLIESLPTARMLLLVNYRPEYQHGWGSKTYYTQLRLDPLPPESAEELLQALLGESRGGVTPTSHNVRIAPNGG